MAEMHEPAQTLDLGEYIFGLGFHFQLRQVAVGIVPDDVRKQGPRRVNRCGAVEALKPEYRLALARDGSMLVRCEAAMCKQEA